MDTLFKLLDNSAFMGMAGLVLGGVVTFFSGFVQSVYNNRHAEKMRDWDIEHKRKIETLEKKERIYKKFLALRGLLLSVQTIQNEPSKTQEDKDKVLSIFAEKFIAALSDSSELFAELDLHAAPEIARKCGEFSYKYALYSNEQFDEMNGDLSEIEHLMRDDLEQYR